MDSVIKGIKQARAAWVDSVMKKELPSRIYAQVHSEDIQTKAQGIGWIKERGYRTEEQGEEMVVMKGTKEIARTKVMLEVNSPEELRALAKICKIRQNGEK